MPASASPALSMNMESVTVTMLLPVEYIAPPFPPTPLALFTAVLLMKVDFLTLTSTLPEANIAPPVPTFATLFSNVQLITSRLPVVAEVDLDAQIAPPCLSLLFLNMVFSTVVSAEVE